MKNTYQKFAKIFLSIMMGLMIFGIIAPAYADQTAFAAVESAEMKKELGLMAGRLLEIEGALNRILWPGLVMIGGLLENDILFGNGMELRLREIWIPIRNIVNIFFVIILVGIALYNITGLADDTYALKSMLPKIIIGIIAVNFSFLMIKVFLDVINVVTVSIFSLPDQVSESMSGTDIGGDEPSEKDTKICINTEGATATEVQGKTSEEFSAATQKNKYINFAKNADKIGTPSFSSNEFDGLSTANEVAAKAKDTWKTQGEIGTQKSAQFDKSVENYELTRVCSGFQLTEFGKAFLSKYRSRNAALVLAINMGKIIYYGDLNKESSGGWEKYVTSVLVSVVLYFVMAISFLALLVVLLARMVVIWLAIVLSPLLIVIMFVPAIKDKLKGIGDLMDKFVAIAIAPIPIALSLTVGWIMLSSMQYVDSIGVGVASVPVEGLTTLQDLLIACGTIAFVFLGVFGAADNTVAEFFTRGLGDFVKGLGLGIAKLPMYAPIIPTVSGSISPMGLYNKAEGAITEFQNESSGGSRGGGGGKIKHVSQLKNARTEEEFLGWVLKHGNDLKMNPRKTEFEENKAFVDSISKSASPRLRTAIDRYRGGNPDDLIKYAKNADGTGGKEEKEKDDTTP